MDAHPAAGPAPVRLRRVLGLPQLIVYGLVLVQPTAPMPLFGVAHERAHGHVVTVILIGMVAMLFTALSYGRMATAYPTAGSAYTYVGRELHPSLGYLTGWSMLFDYVMNPVICVIWCSKASVDLLQRLGPAIGLPGEIPPEAAGYGFVFYAVLFTALNLRGIQASARTNNVLAAGLLLVVLWFLGATAVHLAAHPPADLRELGRPFYDPATFSWGALSGGAALAVLTYIGFDGVTTLAEEVHNPRRNVLLATVWVCVLTGVLASLEVYAAQLAWTEAAGRFPSLENAFAHVGSLVGGPALFASLTLALLVASMGSGMGAHLGGSRLLYGMGRDDAIPRRFFGQLHARTQVPANNILLIGGIVVAGAFVLDARQQGYDLGAQLLNFGALVGFMGVNASAFTHYYLRGRDRRLRHLLPPALGFSVCLYLWWNLSPVALGIGSAWLLLGLLYGAWRTRGYRHPLRMFTADPP